MSLYKYTKYNILIGTDWNDYMDNVLIKLNSDSLLYMQVYNYFKKEIESGALSEGERLPSIRGLANSLSVSKITVEKAYDQLFSEGYIQSNNRARYTVNQLENVKWEYVNTSPVPIYQTSFRPDKTRYDFSSAKMDEDGFDFSLWRRYLYRGLDNTDKLMRYGNPKGEPELRNEIIKYIHRSRGVTANAKNIIVGPSAQSLLSTLCNIMKPENKKIAFEDPGFRHGRQVFLDYGYEVVPIDMRQNGINMNTLQNSDASMVYVSPSHQFPTGLIMSIGKRNKLLSWAEETNSLIIEDDYDSEFRYYGNPIPALKGLDRSGNVIYIGSFSKMIPPSIRISYMLIPDSLLESFNIKSRVYNQSASTLEQLALAKFMSDGNLDRQIRRLRKIYQEKREVFLKAITNTFGDQVNIQNSDSGLFIVMDLKTTLSAKEIKKTAFQKGCKVALMQDYSMTNINNESYKRLILYFSSIPINEISYAVKQLKEAWIK